MLGGICIHICGVGGVGVEQLLLLLCPECIKFVAADVVVGCSST